VDDFYQCRHVGGFDFSAMSPGWQMAQRHLAGEYERVTVGLSWQTVQLLMALAKMR
jgi:hypothetical protein